ncbi:hypothetical protein C0Q70_18408 [Pomacea canaliculata]|uniref:Ig-like domain-containing protein n=1 Tax=Pomacea canaliculata TaxID=400727 RepID=A0A2T7NN40_POMCA|nr:hypothetical protein C0Q70_18408 [Pomacea canaliculata]
MISHELTLEIPQASAKFTGKYACLISQINHHDKNSCEFRMKQEVRCDIPSVISNSSATLTCYFPDYLNNTREDFAIYHHSDIITRCEQKAEVFNCHTGRGYVFDGEITDHVTLRIPSASDEHEGTYSCRIAGKKYQNCSFALNKELPSSLNTSTANDTEHIPLMCRLSVTVIGSSRRWNFSAEHVDVDGNKDISVINLTWKNGYYVRALASGYEIKDLIITVPHHQGVENAVYPCSLILSSDMSKIEPTEPSANKVSDVYITVIVILIVLLVIVIGGFILYHWKRKQSCQVGKKEERKKEQKNSIENNSRHSDDLVKRKNYVQKLFAMIYTKRMVREPLHTRFLTWPAYLLFIETTLVIVILRLLSSFSSAHPPREVRCDIPSVISNSSATLTCYFPDYLNKTREDFAIYHHSDVITRCKQKAEVFNCHTGRGYVFDGEITDHVTVRIPSASDEHEGTYSCRIAGKKYENCSFALNKELPSPLNTSTANDTEHIPLMCRLSVTVIGSSRRWNFSAVHVDVDDNKDTGVVTLTWKNDYYDRNLASGYEIKDLIITVPQHLGVENAVYPCSLILSSDMSKIEPTEPSANKVSDVYIIVIVVLIVLLVIVIGGFILYHWKCKQSCQAGKDGEIGREEEKKWIFLPEENSIENNSKNSDDLVKRKLRAAYKGCHEIYIYSFCMHTERKEIGVFEPDRACTLWLTSRHK